MPRKQGPSRWTDAEVQALRDAVAKAPTAKAAFDQVAKKIGKSPGTVQQKWYSMQRAAGKGVAAGTKAASQVRVSYTPFGKAALRKLDAEELVTLIHNAREILQTKKDEIEERAQRERDALEARLRSEKAAIEQALKSI